METIKEVGTMIAMPIVDDLDTQSSGILTQALSVVVTNNDQNVEAANFLRAIKTLAADISARFEPAKKAAYNAHKAICDMESEHIKPLKEAEFLIKKAVSTWMVEQELKRQKEQVKITKKEIKAGKEELTVVPEIAQPSGISLRENWSANVYDMMALVKAVAAGRAPISYLLPNQKLLDMQAKALKSELKISGVKAIKETSVAARGL